MKTFPCLSGHRYALYKLVRLGVVDSKKRHAVSELTSPPPPRPWMTPPSVPRTIKGSYMGGKWCATPNTKVGKTSLPFEAEGSCTEGVIHSPLPLPLPSYHPPFRVPDPEGGGGFLNLRIFFHGDFLDQNKIFCSGMIICSCTVLRLQLQLLYMNEGYV